MLLASPLVGCGDDDGAAGSAGTSGSGGSAGTAGTGGTGGSGGTGGTAMAEGSICDTTDECVDGLTCVPTGVTTADPMFCARGCERQDQCATTESCSQFCRPTDRGCTTNPAYCATVVNTAWEPCGFATTSTCGTTTAGGTLTCLVTAPDRSAGFCVQICEFNTVGQCPNGQTCSDAFLGSSTLGVCVTPVARGQACDPFAGKVCASTDHCASLTDLTGAGTCRQACVGTSPSCGSGTQCTQFATFGGQPISACFPTASGNQDAGM